MECECQNDVGWKSLDDSALRSQTLFDLSAYTFFVENYPACRQYLQKLSTVSAGVLRKYIDVETMEGYLCALSLSDQKLPPPREKVDGCNVWPKELGRQSFEPELRLKRGFPPALEFFLHPPMTSQLLKGTDLKSRFLKVLASPTEATALINYDSGRTSLARARQREDQPLTTKSRVYCPVKLIRSVKSFGQKVYVQFKCSC